MNLDQKIGQLIVTGFPGSKPDQAFMDLVKKDKVGNVIFFSYNIKSRQQAACLCRELQGCIREETGVLPFITVDEEGGVVSRLPDDAAVLPSAMAQGRAGKLSSIYEGSKIVGEELKALGINFNLAPVLDINSNPRNPVIGVRSFGENAGLVSRCAAQAVRGFLDAGIMCSGKHFPGHGDTDVDSHLGLPCIDKSREELEQEELLPFCHAISLGIPAITIAHTLLPAYETEKIPCTMSKKIITGLLREKLKFNGLVITDCMEMDAIKKFYGTPAGAVEALRAGADLVFISHTARTVHESIEEIKRAVGDGRIAMSRIDEAVQRILKYKAVYAAEMLTDIKADPQNNLSLAKTAAQKKFMDDFYRECIYIHKPEGAEKIEAGPAPLWIGPYPARTSLAENEKDHAFSFSSYLKNKFGGDSFFISLDPSPEEISMALKKTKNCSSIAVGTINAHMNAGQAELVRELAKTGKPMAAAALRNPYDLQGIPESIFQAALYEYSERALKEFSELIFTGPCGPSSCSSGLSSHSSF